MWPGQQENNGARSRNTDRDVRIGPANRSIEKQQVKAIDEGSSGKETLP